MTETMKLTNKVFEADIVNRLHSCKDLKENIKMMRTKQKIPKEHGTFKDKIKLECMK